MFEGSSPPDFTVNSKQLTETDHRQITVKLGCGKMRRMKRYYRLALLLMP
jgi:hypothetical protein